MPQTALPVGQPADDGITVEGAVNKPGVYPVTGQLTFLQAVAASEGFAEDADRRNVVIFRTIEGRRSAVQVNVNRIMSRRAVDPKLQSGDVIVVRRSSVLRNKPIDPPTP